MSKAELPQVLKKLDRYLHKSGLALTAPYDGIRVLDRGVVPCVLCGEETEARIYIPNVIDLESGVLICRVMCANLARCHKRCKDREEAEKDAFEAQFKAIEEHLVFPEDEAE